MRKNTAFRGKKPEAVIRPGSDSSLKKVFKQIGIPHPEPFQPDPFQIKALAAIRQSDCLVTAPTGAGKTWIAEQISGQLLDQGRKIWYATPLKALTNSIHSRFCSLFGKANVGILTGDIKENPDAAIIIGTTEILRNQLYDAMHTGENLTCDLIVLDEAHFLGDEQRGVVWEEIIIYLPVRIPLLLLSATIGNPRAIAEWMASIRGRKCRVITHQDRPVPLFALFLHPSGTLFPLVQASEANAKPVLHKKVLRFAENGKKPAFARKERLPRFGDILEVLHHYHLLPAIFFLKSRSDCDQAMQLCHSNLIARDPDRRQALLERIETLVSSHPHLQTYSHRSYLERTATASHHSGHLPAWKAVVETLMAEGLLDAMFATSTVAAGVNFPARSVVVLNSDRFNGVEFMPLTPSEFQQMSGRAGRRGMDKIGFCIVMPGKYMDLHHIVRLMGSPPTDVESRIAINFSMVLNLLLSHTPDQIRLLLEKSFASHLILSGKKKGRLARKRYGTDLALLWTDFKEHMDFLLEEHFVNREGRLTEDGIWASKLRIDAPLLVAQGIRRTLLPDTDPFLLAAMISAFVNEKEFSDDPLYHQALPESLKQVFLDVRKGLKPFATKMLDKGFNAPNLFIQPCFLVYLWAHGRPWEELPLRGDFAEGDLARLILRTGENLRQITRLTEPFPEIAETARAAMDLILKEPVIPYDD